MIRLILILFTFHIYADQPFHRDINSCQVQTGEDAFANIANLLIESRNNICNESLRENILGSIGEVSKSDFCADFGLRSLENRDCHEFYQYRDPEGQADNITYRCLASVYEGTISGNNPSGAVSGRFSDDAKRSSYQRKVTQLQESFQDMLDEQVNLTTGINQWGSMLLLENMRMPESERSFQCIPGRFQEIMNCNNAEVDTEISSMLGNLRRQQGNTHIIDQLKARYEQAIEEALPSRDVNPVIYSLNELHDELYAAQSGLSFGREYYLDDRELFPPQGGGNLDYMHFYRTYNNTDELRVDVRRQMDENYRERHSVTDLPESYTQGRDEYIAQLERRYNKSQALLKTTQYMLEYYRDVPMDFMPGTKYDHVVDHVDQNIMQQLEDVSAEDLISTGWFTRENGQLKMDRSIAFNMINKAVEGSTNPDDLNTLYIPQNLEDFGGMLTDEADKAFNRLVSRCDSLIEAKENLCMAMETNSMLMNDHAAARCLQEIEPSSDVPNEELVTLAYQYCSGQEDFLFGGEPVGEADNSDWAEYARRERVVGATASSRLSGLSDAELDSREEQYESMVSNPAGQREEALADARAGLEEISRERERREIARVRGLTSRDLQQELESYISLLRNQANLPEDVVANARAGKERIEAELRRRQSIEEMSRTERQCREIPSDDPGLRRWCENRLSQLRAELAAVDSFTGNGTFIPRRNDNIRVPFVSGESNQNVTVNSHENSLEREVQLAESTIDDSQFPTSDKEIINPNSGQVDGLNPTDPSLVGLNNVGDGLNTNLNGSATEIDFGSPTNNAGTNSITSPDNSSRFSPLDSGFENIENRIRGLENNLQQNSTTASSAERIRLEQQLAELRRERDSFLAEQAARVTPEEEEADAVATADRIERNITNTVRRPTVNPSRVEAPEAEVSPVVTDRGFASPDTAAPTSGYQGAIDTPESSGDSYGASTATYQGPLAANEALVLNSAYGDIYLDTTNIATFTQIPDQLVVTSPDQLNIDQMAEGDIVFLRLEDGTIILHEKRSDGTLFRQQVVVGDNPDVARTRLPAAVETEEASEAKIRYDIFREVGN
jgi:hypothetical protein